MTGLMVSMLAFVAGVKDKLESEKGATAVEYGLLMVALIAVVIIGDGRYTWHADQHRCSPDLGKLLSLPPTKFAGVEAQAGGRRQIGRQLRCHRTRPWAFSIITGREVSSAEES